LNTSLYTPQKIDFMKEPIFFGSGRNTQKFEQLKYKFFDEKNDKMLSLFWRPQEIALSKDKQDVETNNTKAENFIVTRVLQKLIYLDSLQGRAPIFTFGQITTLPEIENAILTWSMFEGAIHSRTYSYNLQNIYPNPTEIFDEIFDIEIIMRHAENISEDYEVFYKLVIDYLYMSQHELEITDEFMYKIRKALIRALVSVNILEGTRFYPGFASIWALAEQPGRAKMTGTAKELKLICRDENQHLAVTQKLINILKKDESEGFSEIFEEIKPELVEMYRKAVQQEFEWADYLFSEGSMIGLNAQLLKNFMAFIANKRMKAIGLPEIFEKFSKNPLPWTEHWMTESSTEATPQEEEITDYVSGSIDMDKEVQW